MMEVKLQDLILVTKQENYIDEYNSKFNVPVLKVEGLTNDMTNGYLTLFRFRKFQVSGTRDGVCDLGSGIDTPWNGSTSENFLVKQLIECLNSYFSTSYGYPGYSVIIVDDISCPGKEQVYIPGEKCEKKDGEYVWRKYEVRDFDAVIKLSDLQNEEIWTVLRQFATDSFESFVRYTAA